MITAPEIASAGIAGYTENIQVCPCCDRQVSRLILPINCNITELSFLGSGYPLFLEFIKSCIYLLLLILLTQGVYDIVTNSVFG